MEQGTIVRCCECHQPIIQGEAFVCFKVVGKDSYQYFHRRFRGKDCWEGYVTGLKSSRK